MPRIEIITFSDSSPSETMDVCSLCADDFEEGEEVPEEMLIELEGAIVGSVDVEHPPYDDDEYQCACCGKILGEHDN